VVYVKIIDKNGEVDIDDLTDIDVELAIYDCESLIDKLKDKHRELVDDETA